ncbi:C-C motif chemokine 20 [Chelmon rostratus]|uniref:C-C motif chemokine 20 n=1 Tax=Chelmon rostratus TaxID=109905 RepID=UPI001BE72772|nr:C-C motif chemokine 20 [Chelmon rostratus]
MRFNTLFFLLIVSCLGLALALGNYEDCCFKYMKTMNSRTQKHAVDYRWQVIDGGCNIAAVIFRMRKGRELCTDPTERWVRDLMDTIDGKKAKAKQPRKLHSRHPHRG